VPDGSRHCITTEWIAPLWCSVADWTAADAADDDTVRIGPWTDSRAGRREMPACGRCDNFDVSGGFSYPVDRFDETARLNSFAEDISKLGL
jgi:hypothetical protein